MFFSVNGRITEGTNTSHLDKVQHGYEKMDHFTVNVERQRRALVKVDFAKGAERFPVPMHTILPEISTPSNTCQTENSTK